MKPRELYKFDKFQLDLAERLLTNGTGKRVPISDKAFDTLCVLVQNAGHLVAKDELMDEVWADSFVEENNVDKCIHAIRRALGEKRGEQKFVETVRGHGYRFVATVVQIETLSPSNGNGSGTPRLDSTASRPEGLSDRATAAVRQFPKEFEPSSQIDSKKSARSHPDWLLFTTAITVLVGLGLGLGYYLFANTAPSGKQRVKIAVLPLKPIDSTNRSEDYEIGIADSLINKINSMKGVAAPSLNSIRKYTDLNQDSLAAGKEQQADYVLDARYALAENKLRITWNLINVGNGEIENLEAVETNSGDLFGRQDAVSADIGNKLARRFATTFRSGAARFGTKNEEAYRLYLQGMYLYDRRTLADAKNALDKLDRATQLDPNYAKAWAGKAHVHRSIGYFSVDLSPHEEYEKSMVAINRALALDPDLSDGYSARCENKFFYEYDFEGAETDCKRAIILDPNSYIAHEIYSRCLWTLDRFDEAIKEVELSIDIQPTSLFSQRNYAITFFYARKYPEAIQQFERVAELDPTFVANYAWFVPALLAQGNYAEAFEWFIKWQTFLKVDRTIINAYEKAYQEEGWRGVGRKRVLFFDESKVRSYFLEACLMAHTGNKDKTFEYLERSLERREWGIPFLRIDPSLDGIRDDPRFEDLAKRVRRK